MEKTIIKRLTELEIEYHTYEHTAVFTCKEAQQVADIVPATQCKNLFLKNNKNELFLVVAIAETKINLKKLSTLLKSPGLRFANSELLLEYLHVTPGSVTPFGLLFDNKQNITVILDKSLFNVTALGFHPLRNTATIVITPNDLIKFINSCNNLYIFVNFTDDENILH